MRRKFLSIVLCVCMMLTMAPFAFAKEDGNEATPTSAPISSGGSSSSTPSTQSVNSETELKNAIESASSGSTIKLGQNITLTSTLSITKNITLDGDSHTLSGSVASNTSFINVSIPEDGNFTLTNCIVSPSAKVEPNASIYLSVAGAVTITNCTFGSPSDTEGFMYNGLEFSQTVAMGNTTITGNTFYGGAFRHNCISFYKMNDNATINISNNNFSNLNWDTSNAIRVSNYGSNVATINLDGNTYSDHGTESGQSYAGLLLFQKPENHTDDFTKLTVNISNFSTSSTSQLFYVYDNTGIITTNQPVIKGDSSIAKFCSARIGDTYYASLAKAVADASTANPDTIKLLKDTTERLILNGGKEIILDLGGNTLSYTEQTVRVNHGKLTVNGPGAIKEINPNLGAILIKGSTNQGDTNYSVVDVNGDVTLSGWAPVFVDQNSEKAYGVTVNLNGATLKAQKDTGGNDGVGLYVNGSITDTTNAPAIKLENTTIDAQGEGMYLAGYADTTIKGGSIVGTQTGIEIRAGKLAVNGVTVTGNGTPTTVTPNGNGSTADGVGIAVMQHTTKLPINVTISDSKVSGYNGVLQNNPQTNSAEDIAKVTINIESGYFSAINGGVNAVASENNRLTITGGYFTSDPSAYCVSGKTGIPSTEPGYAFTVGEKANTEVKPATAAPAVDDSKIAEADKATATAVGQSVQDTTGVLSAAANEAAKKIADDQVANAKAQLKREITTVNNDTPVYTYAQTYLKVTPTAVTKNGESITSITLDIQPMSRVVASTVNLSTDTGAQLITEGNAKNAVVLKNSETELLNIKTMVISFELPAGFVTKNADGITYPNVYVQHKGHEYTATVTKDANNKLIATFTNPDGFSEFTISKDPVSVATIGQNRYTTLQDAVDAVKDNETINVTGDNLSATVSGNKTFSVTGKTVTLTAASGYNLTENGNTYTVSHQSSGGPGSSGGSISTPTTYAVNVNAATNGAVAADKKTASKGTTVTVTASPSKGYVVDAVKVVDKDGKDVAVTEKDGKYVFAMPGSAVTVTGTFKAETPVALPFTDVKSGDWFYPAVQYAYAQGLMTGTSATTFAPNGTMNRAMIVTVLYRLEKSPAVTGASKFTDVPAGQWYSDAVAWAAANKIVNGYDETTFGPMNAVTREQMAAILFRYEQVKGLENVTLEENLNRFPDQNKISAYAIPALQWAVGQKIINGNADGTLDPTGTATRAQVAQIFTNLLNQ